MSRARSANDPQPFIGVVLPVHNEEALLDAALSGVDSALGHADLIGLVRHLVVVLDDCQDASSEIADRWVGRLSDRHIGLCDMTVLEVSERNVGSARRTGCSMLLERWRSVPPDSIWLATTDGDSVVPPNWLAVQLARKRAGAGVWMGSVTVVDWSSHQVATAEEWVRRNKAEHEPTHGASFGIAGDAYLGTGGFENLATGEDRALMAAARAWGAEAFYDRSAPVSTSARRDARAPDGFSRALRRIEAEAEPASL
jgi:glycosyltransferase involved in cell wall biosynthesis